MEKRNKIELIKVLALIIMLIDHMGIVFFPQYIWMRLIGRLGAPIYFYGISQGIVHTHNIKKYLLRLLFLALISQIPYYLIINQSNLNVVFNLLIAAASLYLLSKNPKMMITIFAITILIYILIPIDYGVAGYLIILGFYLSNINNSKIYNYVVYPIVIWIIYIQYGLAISLLQSIYILSIYLIYLIDIGIIVKNQKYKVWKNIYYFFYPGHLTIMFLVTYIITMKPTSHFELTSFADEVSKKMGLLGLIEMGF